MDIMEMVTKAILYGAIIGTVLAEVLKEINDYFKNHKQQYCSGIGEEIPLVSPDFHVHQQVA